MTYYDKEIKRVRADLFSNESQVATVVGIKNFIESNYDKKVNLDLISCMRYTSKFHLLRLYKKYYGITPHQYLIEVRIRKAKELLLQGKSVSDTCYLVGFESLSSFTGLFKKKTSFTPTEFRKKAILEKSYFDK